MLFYIFLLKEETAPNLSCLPAGCRFRSKRADVESTRPTPMTKRILTAFFQTVKGPVVTNIHPSRILKGVTTTRGDAWLFTNGDGR